VYGPRLPILGVCLGHQCIGAAYGARIIRAGRAVHGRTSHIVHTGAGILRGVPSPFLATRYHSLVIARDRLPPALDVIAEAEDDHEIMAIVHRTHPVTGVQFHPESAATEFGYTMLDAFLRGAASRSWPAHADGVGARILATSTERPDNHRGDYGQEEE
jgi:anthranilate synthase/aminodeoxychorismate synthase-like glutamine amidotransferase